MAEQDVWTGEEFANRIALDPALLARAKADWDVATQTTMVKPLRAKAAREIVSQSIRLSFSDEIVVDDEQVEKLADLIVQALPKEAMNGSIVQALDVRPYIQLVASEPRQFPGDKTRQGFRPLARAWQQQQEQEYRATGNAYKQTNAAGINEVTTTAQQSVAEMQGLGSDQYMLGNQTVDLTDLAAMVRTGKVNINDPELETATFTMGNVPGVGSVGPGGGGRSIGRTTVGGALDWMFGLDETQVATMQSLLANAGYMTDLKYSPETDQWIMQDMRYEEGYANDPVTRQALLLAVNDAFSQGNGMSMRQWLSKKTIEFKQREDSMRTRLTEQRLTTFNESLGDVRAVADRLAMETVGRRLNPQEFVEVRQYLRSLQSERVDDPFTQTPAAWMQSDPQRGFTQDELTMQVQDVVEPEVLRRQNMSMNYQMKKWLEMD